MICEVCLNKAIKKYDKKDHYLLPTSPCFHCYRATCISSLPCSRAALCLEAVLCSIKHSVFSNMERVSFYSCLPTSIGENWLLGLFSFPLPVKTLDTKAWRSFLVDGDSGVPGGLYTQTPRPRRQRGSVLPYRKVPTSFIIKLVTSITHSELETVTCHLPLHGSNQEPLWLLTFNTT